jgi:hypothetical protein
LIAASKTIVIELLKLSRSPDVLRDQALSLMGWDSVQESRIGIPASS